MDENKDREDVLHQNQYRESESRGRQAFVAKSIVNYCDTDITQISVRTGLNETRPQRIIAGGVRRADPGQKKRQRKNDHIGGANEHGAVEVEGFSKWSVGNFQKDQEGNSEIVDQPIGRSYERIRDKTESLSYNAQSEHQKYG